MDEKRKKSLLTYCRIDILTSEDDALLESIYDAAVAYMTAAGISEPAVNSPRKAQYDLCVNAMVLHDWDSRGSFLQGGAATDNPAFRRMMNQLKHTEPLEPLASGGAGA